MNVGGPAFKAYSCFQNRAGFYQVNNKCYIMQGIEKHRNKSSQKSLFMLS